MVAMYEYDQTCSTDPSVALYERALPILRWTKGGLGSLENNSWQNAVTHARPHHAAVPVAHLIHHLIRRPRSLISCTTAYVYATLYDLHGQ